MLAIFWNYDNKFKKVSCHLKLLLLKSWLTIWTLLLLFFFVCAVVVELKVYFNYFINTTKYNIMKKDALKNMWSSWCDYLFLLFLWIELRVIYALQNFFFYFEFSIFLIWAIWGVNWIWNSSFMSKLFILVQRKKAKIVYWKFFHIQFYGLKSNKTSCQVANHAVCRENIYTRSWT